VSLRVGWCHDARVYSCAYVCGCMCVCVCIYVHFFAMSVACTLEQVFWVLVLGQVCMLQRCFFDINVHICEHTRCKLWTYVYMHKCVYMYAYIYGYVYASIILLDMLRCRY